MIILVYATSHQRYNVEYYDDGFKMYIKKRADMERRNVPSRPNLYRTAYLHYLNAHKAVSSSGCNLWYSCHGVMACGARAPSKRRHTVTHVIGTSISHDRLFVSRVSTTNGPSTVKPSCLYSPTRSRSLAHSSITSLPTKESTTSQTDLLCSSAKQWANPGCIRCCHQKLRWPTKTK